MKMLDAAWRIAVIAGVGWWAINLPIGRLEAQTPAAPADLPALMRKLDAAIAKNDAAVAKAEAVLGRLEAGPKPPGEPAPAPGDAVARELGANYRRAILEAHREALEAVAKAEGVATMIDLAAIQAKAAAEGRKRAGEPIVAELTKRFGDPDEGGDVAGARKFYEELAAGFGEAK